jgi:UDP-GlcNAc:undecaprenyl-phosphate GlcNAc-1-phosphate transferase
MLAAVTLLENRKGTATVTLLFPLVALALPIADSVRAFIRRAMSGKHVFVGDSGHIHHRLLRLGLTHAQATLLLWGLSAVLGLVAVLLADQPREKALWIAGGLGVVILVVFEAVEVVARRRASETDPG